MSVAMYYCFFRLKLLDRLENQNFVIAEFPNPKIKKQIIMELTKNYFIRY